MGIFVACNRHTEYDLRGIKETTQNLGAVSFQNKALNMFLGCTDYPFCKLHQLL